MKITISLTICVLVSLAASCVQSRSVKKVDEYSIYRDAGDRAILSREFDEALKNYEKALEIAVKSRRGDTIAFANGNIAQTYCSAKRFNECEAQLEQARGLCIKDSSCGSDAFSGLLDKTRFLYVFLLKDPEKTATLYDLLEQSREKLGEEEYKRLGCKYADDMSGAGYTETAKKLFERHNCLGSKTDSDSTDVANEGRNVH